VLLNLIGNAIRYSPDGSMIWIRCETSEGRASITVADQGQGLSADQQAVVFEKFERLGRTDSGGSGLGLYIARRLARAMDGDLTVESAQGQGARFTLRLPAANKVKEPS
jgi:signal transduction histidine kinase